MARVASPGTPIGEVAQAVAAVKQLQEQVAGLLEAVRRLTTRIEAVEAAQAGKKTDG